MMQGRSAPGEHDDARRTRRRLRELEAASARQAGTLRSLTVTSDRLASLALAAESKAQKEERSFGSMNASSQELRKIQERVSRLETGFDELEMRFNATSTEGNQSARIVSLSQDRLEHAKAKQGHTQIEEFRQQLEQHVKLLHDQTAEMRARMKSCFQKLDFQIMQFEDYLENSKTHDSSMQDLKEQTHDSIMQDLREQPPLVLEERDDREQKQSLHWGEPGKGNWQGNWEERGQQQSSAEVVVPPNAKAAGESFMDDEAETENLSQQTGHPHDLNLAVGFNKCTSLEDSKAKNHVVAHDAFQECLLRVINSHFFKVFQGLLIFGNTVVIAVEADFSIRNCIKVGRPDVKWYEPLDYFFTPAFTLELLIRLLAERMHFFNSSDIKWNLFDALLVSTAVSELFFQTLNLSFMRILRILRMLRMLRILRVVKWLRELRLMVESILVSMLTLFWAFALMVLIQFCFAICFIEASVNYLLESDTVESDVYDGIVENFPDLLHAIYTLTTVISGGLEWTAISDLLVEMSPWYMALFFFYITFVTYGVINVLAAIFVESANRISENDKEQVLKAEMEKANSFVQQFAQLCMELDEDKNGTLSWSEIVNHLEDPRVLAFLEELELDLHEAHGLFRLMDWGDSGEVPLEEFVVGCLRMKGFARSVEVAGMMFEQKKAVQMQKKESDAISKTLDQIMLLLRKSNSL